MTAQSRPPLLTTAHTRVEQGIRVKAKVDKRLSGKMVMSTLCPPHPPTPSIHIIFVIITTTKPALCVGKQTWWNFWGHHPGLEAMGSSLIRSLIVQLNAISCVHFGPDSCLMAHLNAISIEFCALQWKQIVKCKSFLYFGDLSYLQPQSIAPIVCHIWGAAVSWVHEFVKCTAILVPPDVIRLLWQP